MNGRINENELLGFIEGDLPAERMLEIERALRADRGLAATLDAMRRDRVLLRAEFASMFAQAGGKAPHRTVQEAIEFAEREAILASAGEPRRAGVLARIGGARWVAMAASVALLATSGVLIWNSTQTSPGRQIGGQQAAGVAGAMDDVLGMTTGDELATSELASTGRPVISPTVPDPREITQSDISNAIALNRAVTVEREAMRSRVAPALSTLEARSWSDLHRDAPVLPTRSPTRLANELPLAAIVEALDRSRIDWSRWDNEVLTLAVNGRSRAFAPAQYHDLPEAAPASYEDALRLASLNRLSLRVVADDPVDVEQELFRLASQHGMTVQLTNRGDACGALAYSIEMPRTKGGMEALINAVCGCDERQVAARRTYFDVSLLPVNAAPRVGESSLSLPVQITGGAQRVSVPVLIERRAER
jgi:hypothetical protein